MKPPVSHLFLLGAFGMSIMTFGKSVRTFYTSSAVVGVSVAIDGLEFTSMSHTLKSSSTMKS